MYLPSIISRHFVRSENTQEKYFRLRAPSACADSCARSFKSSLACRTHCPACVRRVSSHKIRRAESQLSTSTRLLSARLFYWQFSRPHSSLIKNVLADIMFGDADNWDLSRKTAFVHKKSACLVRRTERSGPNCSEQTQQYSWPSPRELVVHNRVEAEVAGKQKCPQTIKISHTQTSMW